MKKATFTQIALSVALPAVAVPASAGVLGPKPKTHILHCGCSKNFPGLELIELKVNSSGLSGHAQHQKNDYEYCDYWGEAYYRDRSDCWISGPGSGVLSRTCNSGYPDYDIAGDDCD